MHSFIVTALSTEATGRDAVALLESEVEEGPGKWVPGPRVRCSEERCKREGKAYSADNTFVLGRQGWLVCRVLIISFEILPGVTDRIDFSVFWKILVDSGQKIQTKI